MRYPAVITINISKAGIRGTGNLATPLVAIAVIFSLLKFIDYLRKKLSLPASPNIIKGGFWCAVCEFTSFITHSGGPPLNVYTIPERLDKFIYMGTLAIFYTYVNYAKISPYWWLGQFNITNLSTSVTLLPVVPIGIFIGLWIQRRIDALLYLSCYYDTLICNWHKAVVRRFYWFKLTCVSFNLGWCMHFIVSSFKETLNIIIWE